VGIQAPAVMGDTPMTAPTVSRGYSWSIFALTFGLLLADYMSRQVLNAVFPLLKAQWLLSDTQLVVCVKRIASYSAWPWHA
jgi:hypothetical protein